MTWQGVSEAECYDNRSVIAQIVRIKDRLTAVEQNVDPTIREDLEAAVAELTALENTVGNVETQVEANTGSIAQVQDNVDTLEGEVETALTTKADKTELADGSVTKVGTADVGSTTGPIYLATGTPTACDDVFFVSTGTTAQGVNRNKHLVLCSGSGQFPKTQIDADGLETYKSQNSYIRIKRSDSTVLVTSGSYQADVECTNGYVQAKSFLTKRSIKTGAIDLTKPWGISINGSVATMEIMIHTPDGALKFLMTDPDVIGQTTNVQMIATLPGFSIVAAAAKGTSAKTIYVKFPTAYAASTVSVNIETMIPGSNTSPTAPTIGTTNYEDVVLDGLHIPNIANYDANYNWSSVI